MLEIVMKTRLAMVVLSVVTVVSHLPIAAAQIADQSWARVIAQPPGTKLNVKLNTGKTVEGTVIDVSDKVLRLTKGNSRIDLARDQIKKIYQVRGTRVGKSTLIGLGIGAASGVAIGGVVAASDRPTESGEGHLPVLIIGTVGAAVGATTGVLTGLLGRKTRLIYEAK